MEWIFNLCLMAKVIGSAEIKILGMPCFSELHLFQMGKKNLNQVFEINICCS